ncbi:MAG: HD domain-containing phosphohydrolase [Chloroflexota bacterium]
MKILYVEDDPFDADLTRRALQRTAPHFSLEIARSQQEALGCLASAERFELLLTDLRLPDGSGFALLSHVRENKLPLAVVVITGQGDEEIAVSALKAGANDYLVKRQNYLDHLWVTLENALERYKMEEARRQRPLRILYLDNHPNDIELARRHFASHAPHIHLEVVHTAREVFQRLPGGEPLQYDALMLDYHQQEPGALDLLKELRQARALDLPIVLVTARGDEELAAQALRLGASDYVVKSPGYLFGLPGLMENAYHRAQLLREQQALQASEERFRRLAENAPDIIYRLRLQPRAELEYISPAAYTITGYRPEQLLQDFNRFVEAIHPEDLSRVREVFSSAAQSAPIIFRLLRTDGQMIWMEGRNVGIYDSSGSLVAHEGILRDITERKTAEEHIQRQLRRLNALRTIDISITGNLGLLNTLDTLLEHVLLQLGAHAAGILLFNTGKTWLEYRAAKGFRGHRAAASRLSLDTGPAHHAIRSGQTIHIANLDQQAGESELAQLWREEGFVAYHGAPLVAKGETLGVLEVYHRVPLTPDPEWLSFLDTLAGQAAIAIDNATLVDSLQHANRELSLAYDTTLEGWVRLLDLRDKETEDHTQRVTRLTMELAHTIGMSEEMQVHLRRGALLHDVGKIGIADSILNKAGPLTIEEMATMRRHPEYAFSHLNGIEYLKQALDVPYCHHEWWDGSGYPRGLKGENIPISARIFAVVDVYDALTSDRPYRKAWDQATVLEYIREQSGTHFDPQVVEAFLHMLQPNA